MGHRRSKSFNPLFKSATATFPNLKAIQLKNLIGKYYYNLKSN